MDGASIEFDNCPLCYEVIEFGYKSCLITIFGKERSWRSFDGFTVFPHGATVAQRHKLAESPLSSRMPGESGEVD